MQPFTLTDYLSAKGVRNDLRVKRVLAVALGLPFDNGTPEQESALLSALKVGSMANGETRDSYSVEIAFESASFFFDTFEKAHHFAGEQSKAGKYCRILKQVTVSALIQVINP